MRELTRHQVAIAGRISNAQTGGAVGGAQVEITDGPLAFVSSMAIKARQHAERWPTLAKRPNRTRTADDGHFYFIDLPQGKYTLVASLPDYGSRYATATMQAIEVKQGVDGTISMAVADMALPATTLKGQVSRKGGQAVLMAQVFVKGSGERAFSDAQGQYVLAGLQAGQRNVEVSLQGYRPVSQTVKLEEPGVVQTMDFALEPSSP